MNKETTNPTDKYDEAESERQRHIDGILNSKSSKKIVVAGPGTGKTSLFKKILQDKKNSLTLTFVNTLVEDLSLELYGLSEVRTLHSFAHRILRRSVENITVFPKLSEVIKEDAKILINQEIDFDKLFHNRDEESEYISFYSKRRKYYVPYYGYSDIIFEAVKYLESNRDKIPIYDQVVVDEFQDFNRLEVSLIDLLHDKSPVLLAGDDDQAIYDFKSASPEHIRQRHGDTRPDFASFDLPFCSRSTRVIVEATNDITNAAMKNGFLKGRVNKRYKYFNDAKKDAESDKNPKIIYSQLFAAQIPWFIENQIGKIAEVLKSKFSVLIISPTTTQSCSIAEALENKGFGNIEYANKRDGREPTLLDGLKILLESKQSNLGWRIVAKHLLKEKDFESLLRETDKEKAKNTYELIERDCKTQVKEMIKVLKGIKDGKTIDENTLDEVLRKIGFNPDEMIRDILKKELIYDSLRGSNTGIRKIPIKATTKQGSKGLSRDCVFITHFDDQYFISSKDKKISDQDICNFLVALTRARIKVFLISSKKQEPTFLKWINKDRIEKI